MARNDEGEFELILGNRQLMSVLFILVVLLGVFFTMGYIVGRSNPATEKVAEAAKDQVAMAEKGPPTVVEPGGVVIPPAAVEVLPGGKPSPSDPGPSPGPEKQEPQKTDAGKLEPAKPEPPKPEQKKQETKKAESPKQPEPPKPTPPPASGAVFAATPPPGVYLQVAAIDRPGASGMAEAYRKQGFNSLVTNSSSPTLFRVIIGPLPTDKAVSDTKQKLEALGVKGAILRKF
jgi:hypothetical protein